jgi:hypothetical protein
MKSIIPLTIASAIGLLAAGQVRAVQFTFQENGSNVDLGPTSTFTEGGISLTVSGFFTSGGSTDLYAKSAPDSDGASETGLGTTSDPTGQHEITTSNFVQLTLPTTPPSNFQLVLLGSVQAGESANVYFSHTPGTLAGATLIGTIDGNDGSVAVPAADQTGYIDVTAGKGNVLLSGAIVNTPDGGPTVTLLGFAVAAIGLIQRIAPKSLQPK